MRRSLAALCVMGACATGSVHATSGYSANYIFGDSLSDTGNLLLLTESLNASNPAIPVVPLAPYYNGRFSNGPNSAELFSNALGLQALPSLAGGTDYAFGGARTSYHTISAISSVASFNAQIGTYLSAHSVADPNALFTINIGSNDLSDVVTDLVGGNSAGANMLFTGAVQSIGTGLSQLIASGARSFVMPTITDLGLTPEITSYGSPQLQATVSNLALTFNQAVNGVISNFLSTTPGLTIYRPDLYSLLDNAVANPSAYGFTNVTDACFSGAPGVSGTVCATPDTYLFWDSEHPTALAQQIMANTVLAAVPEPGAVAMLLAGLGLIGFARRRAAAV